MRKSLSIPEWHDLVVGGNAPPVRILISGYSMFPLIRYQKDYVTIVALDAPPKVGDVVLFVDPPKDRYVLHRVWQVEADRALTWGDNCDYADGWIPISDIWGKAVQVERGRRTIHMNVRRGMLWASFWHRAGRVYRFARRIRNGLARRIKRLLLRGR